MLLLSEGEAASVLQHRVTLLSLYREEQKAVIQWKQGKASWWHTEGTESCLRQPESSTWSSAAASHERHHFNCHIKDAPPQRGQVCQGDQWQWHSRKGTAENQHPVSEESCSLLLLETDHCCSQGPDHALLGRSGYHHTNWFSCRHFLFSLCIFSLNKWKRLLWSNLFYLFC